MSKILQITAFALLLIIYPLELLARQLRVPSQYQSIQSAINAAGSGDTVLVAPGSSAGPIIITKNINLIGQGSPQSTIHAAVGEGAVITIRKADVTISGIEVNGGRLVSATNRYKNDSPGLYSEESSKGIVAYNSRLVLQNVVVNNIYNYLVIINKGSLIARDLKLFTRSYWKSQADVGIKVQGSRVHIIGLRQPSAWIDHTIDINNPGRDDQTWGRSDVTVKQSHIRSSALSWGDCIRTYSDASLDIDSMYCYRTTGGREPKYDNHTGVSLNGSRAQVRITNSRFTHVPVGVNIHPGIGEANRVFIENCTFEDNPRAAILINSIRYPAVDLGGGHLGSKGGNRFTRMPSYDVKLTRGSTINVPAFGNQWSRPDPNQSIWDRKDDPTLGKVLWGGE